MNDLAADWRKLIPGTMGAMDALFAGHPLDEKRAFDLLVRLRQEGVGFSEVESAFRNISRKTDAAQTTLSSSLRLSESTTGFG